MTTSEGAAPDGRRVYVWVWLPGAADPIVAGALTPRAGVLTFAYARSYLGRAAAIPLYTPELPLRTGPIEPPTGMTLAGCLRDAAPDAWGQRVILARHTGSSTSGVDTADLSMQTYLVESGTDRVGGLDFQLSPDQHVPRQTAAPLEELLTAAERIDSGQPLTPELALALQHGTSVGGARPKAVLREGHTAWIAKMSSHTDPYPVVRAEAAAMTLAARCGLDVAPTRLVQCLGRDVLLVERFDRHADGPGRRLIVSALTILGLDEMYARYATYHELAQSVRDVFTAPEATLRELFARIAFNVAVGNIDDHARNHAAFWDGRQLTLTPAYDLCPQVRAVGEVHQAMAYAPGERRARLATVVAAAPTYGLTVAEGRQIVERIIATVRADWAEAAERAHLTRVQRDALWQRQILNPSIFYT